VLFWFTAPGGGASSNPSQPVSSLYTYELHVVLHSVSTLWSEWAMSYSRVPTLYMVISPSIYPP
jgi:hypothetical protein